MGVLPTDPKFIALSQNEELLQFTAHWLRKYDNDLLTVVSKALGIIWDRDQVAAMTQGKEKATAPNEMFLPLAAAVNPELLEGLAKAFRVTSGKFIGGGEYTPAGGEEVVELGDLPPEEFMQWASKATGIMRDVAAEMEQKQRTVTVQEGPSNDQRIQRIRDQINKSKKWQT
jgi:hypothetical protein